MLTRRLFLGGLLAVPFAAPAIVTRSNIMTIKELWIGFDPAVDGRDRTTFRFYRQAPGGRYVMIGESNVPVFSDKGDLFIERAGVAADETPILYLAKWA